MAFQTDAEGAVVTTPSNRVPTEIILKDPEERVATNDEDGNLNVRLSAANEEAKLVVLPQVQYMTTPPPAVAGDLIQAQADSTGSLFVDPEGRKATYSCLASFTPVAGDIALIAGASGKVITVTRVEVSLSTSGTAALETVQLIKRSTADTGGTPVAMTAVPHDKLFPPAAATVSNYTAAPTLGAAVGSIRGVQFNDQSAALPGAASWLWTFGDRPGARAFVLRGAQDQLCINLGGVVATQTAIVSIEWTEE
jgi:hypothetical protein